MQTKFYIGDFLLLGNGAVRRIQSARIDEDGIEYYLDGGHKINEKEITRKYLEELEESLRVSKKTLEFMRSKITGISVQEG